MSSCLEQVPLNSPLLNQVIPVRVLSLTQLQSSFLEEGFEFRTHIVLKDPF
jgi:hypothetical protein